MSEFNRQNINQVELRAAYAEDALRPGGVVYEIAQNALNISAQLTPYEIGNVLMPPKKAGEAKDTRWELVANAKDVIKATAAVYQDRIYELATTLEMRQPESISPEKLTRIRPADAIWLAEGGANRTSVVRRQLAFEAMAAVYGNVVVDQVLYQFGSDRLIPRQKLNADKQPFDNPEYIVALEIAGNYLPEDDSLTEFGLNLASAQQSGYQIVSEISATDTDQCSITLQKVGLPELVLIQPNKIHSGLEAGFTAVAKKISVQGKQFVIATNGQYRPKDELQAQRWAEKSNLIMLPAVALGDEPGYAVQHAGKTITTAARTALVYSNEMVILQRLG